MCSNRGNAHGEHWGTTCSVLIPPSPSAQGLEPSELLEPGLQVLLESQGFTSDPGKQCHSLVKGQANTRGVTALFLLGQL